MNERIEKMMLEATKDIPQGYYVPPQYFEKFAELIVRECIQAIQNESKDPMDELEYGLRVAEGAILDHFGVEE